METVLLFDHRGNEFEVAAVKRGCEVFLGQGWRQVGRCLGLGDGGWLKMIYVGCGRFFIEARDRMLNAPFCPAPPRIIRLHDEPRVIHRGDSDVTIVDPSVYVGRKPTVVMTLYASVQAIDVSTSFLHLPVSFCDVIFPRVDCDVTLVDKDGKAWQCSLLFPSCNVHSDVLLRGWRPIMDAHEVAEGYGYKLEVPVDTTSLMFFGSQ